MSNHMDLIKLLIDDSENDTYISDKLLIDNIIFQEIYGLISQRTPPDFPVHHYNLKENIRIFIDKLIYKQLTETCIISLGGSFSSGKSSFVNSILNINMLPENISPTTAVPTYILKADDTNIYVTNNYQNRYPIDLKEIKNIAHSYNKFDPDYVKTTHLIKNIIVETHKFPFDNLAFLDTPGYSKSEIFDYEKSDEAKAMFYYNSGDCLFWFIPSDVGTITEEDLDILQNVKKSIPKVIIVNKADKLTESDLNKVVEQIKSGLESRAISYVDIFTFSKRMPNTFDKHKILDYLKSMDKPKESRRILDGFSNFFDTILAYYNKLIVDESRRLFRLNHAITFIDDSHAINSILILSDEIKENILEIKTLINKLNSLRIKLFMTLRESAAKSGIAFSDNFDEYISGNTRDFLARVYDFNGTNLVNRNFDYNRKIAYLLKDLNNISFTEIFEKMTFEFNDSILKFLNERKTEDFSFANINHNMLCSQKIKAFLSSLELDSCDIPAGI